MTAHPPTYHFDALGSEAHNLARRCSNERLAMILHSVAVGSMIVMAGAAAAKLLKELFGHPGHHDRSK
jgi:hypothetical protein